MTTVKSGKKPSSTRGPNSTGVEAITNIIQYKNNQVCPGLCSVKPSNDGSFRTSTCVTITALCVKCIASRTK